MCLVCVAIDYCVDLNFLSRRRRHPRFVLNHGCGCCIYHYGSAHYFRAPCGSLALHSVKTGAGTLHYYEAISGLRIALYTNNNPTMITGGRNLDNSKASFQTALKHIYSELWVDCVVRSPLYRPGDIQVEGDGIDVGRFDIKSTNFEKRLDAYLASMPWFR